MQFDIKRFEDIRLEIGTGKNCFSMKRGSFVYRQKNVRMQKLYLRKKVALPDGFELHYESKAGKYAGKICVKLHENRLQIVCRDMPFEKVNRYRLIFPTNQWEHIYGCGETYSKLDLKGEKVRIWVAEHQNTRRISGKILREKLLGKHPERTLAFSAYESYYAQPTFVSSDKYFVHVNTNAFAEFDFSNRGQIVLELQEEPEITIGWGDSFEAVSEGLSDVLGRQKALPDWIYDGGILAVQEGCDTVDRKIETAQRAGVKITAVWCQDWSGCRRTGFGYQVMWNWQRDDELYPKLPDKIAEWKKKGVRFLGYINPFLAIEKNIYREASEKGYCVKNKKGEDYMVTITTFPAAMIDFTNPKAYEWYKNLIKENMIGIGMSGWMADFGEYLPIDCVLYSGENPEVVHNQWPAIWAKLNREAIRECHMEEEIFFFTRAGHTGTIAHSDMMWTGDQHVDWSVDDGLPSVIPATLSLAMSGFGITHSDAGGYTTIMHMRRSKELLMRWEEMNAFSPLFRTHEGNQPVNNVQFDNDAELLAHLAKCMAIHVSLKKYIKDCVAEAVQKGIPVMRPLFYHYDEEKLYQEKGEYLLGRDILVAPVLKEGVSERTCLLPSERWVHLFTGQEYGGGKVTVQAPIGQPPVFIRRNSERFEELMKISNCSECASS
ncbi:MAG: alpha-glucosidase [Lachnospiraceae bacterium]|nr:alpha-glucosidase [Lachnospiraceae bacterium]